MRLNSLLLAMASVPGLACAAQPEDRLPGLYFSHADWELACDNTGTCRAAGYQAGQGAPAVSVLLTRKAGPGQPVSGQVLVGERAGLPPSFKLTLRIDGRNAGTVSAGRKSAALPHRTVAALLGALPGTARIAWSAGPHSWQLSSQGAAAVLLKMDEFQGRIGTRGALLKPGAGSEAGVLQPDPVPVVHAARWAPPSPADARLATEQAEPLRLALRATLGEQDYCPDLDDGDGLALRRLDAQRLLASSRCWSGPYNVGHGYWVINAAPPFQAQLVTTSGTDAEEPFITASHKGRGMGDCRSSDIWTWNGAAFIHTSSATTGMCRMAAAGGAWELPRIVSDVRPAP
jgi:hypothetical protein